MSKSIIFTLFEGNYSYGVGALINSAIKSKFRGKFIIGFKGLLPFWIDQLIKKSDFYFIPDYEGIEIEFIEIKTDLHLRYYKAFLFEELLLKYNGHKIFYFDPDITVIGDWEFFEEWVEYGAALVLDDCYPIMPYTHPIKQQWAKIYNFNIENSKDFNFYVNSGFVGGSEGSIDLIKKWKQNILLLKELGYDLTNSKPAIIRTITHKRLNPIIGDQDILNATIIQNYSSIKLSIIGQDGMGFNQSGYLMLHNTGRKTWNKNFMLNFIRNGVKINLANYSYIENSFKPINLNPKYFQKFLLRIDLLGAQILQRIF